MLCYVCFFCSFQLLWCPFSYSCAAHGLQYLPTGAALCFHLQWSKPSAEATIPWVCCSDADNDEPDHEDIAA